MYWNENRFQPYLEKSQLYVFIRLIRAGIERKLQCAVSKHYFYNVEQQYYNIKVVLSFDAARNSRADVLTDVISAGVSNSIY